MSLDLSVGGTNISTYGFNVYRIVKPLSPEQNQNTIDIPKRPGLIQATKKFTQYPYTVRGALSGTSPSDLIDKLEALAGFLYSDDDVELIANNQTDRYWNGQYLDSIEILREHSFGIFDLHFTCNDPLGYAVTADTDDTNITVLDDTYNVTNSGHYYARPVITITFNQAQSHIYIQSNNISGNRFDISKSFETNDVLEVDCKDETIKLNGSDSPIGFGSGGNSKAEFLLLAVGANELQVGTDDEDIDITINLEWRKVYLY
jgi:predicted phage tail component-like protein